MAGRIKKGNVPKGWSIAFLVSKEGTPLGFTWGQRDSSYITHLISDFCIAGNRGDCLKGRLLVK